MSTNYDINYDDQRFSQVESEKTDALSDLEKTYTDMIDKTDSFYQSQIDASKEYADKQSQLQQEKTDFAIEKIEQQKAQAQKDYTREQSGAYVDWQKQSNQYGANAEQMAAQGMQNSGYSESSQVSMYNTYQNRVMAARDAYQRAVLNYDNSITEARLQNNSLLAEIAYKALQQQLELSLQGFQYKNQLVLDKTKQKLEVDNMYYQRYQDVLQQINTEHAMAEQVRQFNEKLAEEKRQYDETMAYNKEKSASSGGGGGGGYYYSSGSSTKSSTKSSDTDTSTKTAAVTKETPAPEPEKKTTTTGKTINMQSVLDLGEGPISAQNLAAKQQRGEVVSIEVGNQVYFKKTNNNTSNNGTKKPLYTSNSITSKLLK